MKALQTVALSSGLFFFTQLFAQNPTTIEIANLREDLRILQQTVGELRLTVEQLQSENARLLSQNRSAADSAVTLSQLNQALAALKQSSDAALLEQRREIIDIVTRQLDRLSKQAEPPPARPLPAPATLIFTDDFSKEGTTHTVQAGESLSAIAKKYGASLRDIQNANKISDTSRIQAGQTLFIPNPKR